MATMSEINQATINGMNSNGQDHLESHSAGRESPAKNSLHTQDIMRFPSKFDIHREKSPVPEHVSDASAPASENNLDHSAKHPSESSVDSSTHTLDPTGVVISSAEETSTLEKPAGSIVEKFDEDSAEKSSEDAEASSGAEETPEAPAEEPAAVMPEAEEKTTDIEMADIGKEEEKVDETSMEQTDAAEENAEPGKSVKKGRKKGRKQATTPKKQVSVTEQPASSSPKRTVTPRKRKTTEGEESRAKDVDKTPLLEAPLVVEGKRSRQRVDRLDVNISTPDKKEFEIPCGKGLKLGEISFIDAMISKTPFNDLKTLHRILFGKVGSGQEIKRNLRQFCGFGFDASSKDCEKKKKSIEHLTMPELKSICGLVGLERANKKEEIVEAVLSFLIEPTDKGKKPPAAKRASSRKRSASSSASKKRTTRKKTSTKSGAAASEESATDEEDQDKEEQSGVSEKEKSDVEDVEPPTKKTRRSKAPATPVASKKQLSSPGKSGKKPHFPSDAELKNTVKELLKGVNLEAVTMKEMTSKVYSKYPSIDLTSKKDYIKDAVKTLLSSSD